MSGTTGTSPIACWVDAAGIHSYDFNTILTYLQSQVQSIYGSDIYLGNDSQDGQFVGIFAQAIYDTNSMAIAVYNSYSPSTAQGVGLSSVVKINGIARLIPTNSTVDLTIIGVAGTNITNGVVTDSSNNQWSILGTVIVPASGQITATAQCTLPGQITAVPNSIITIATPILGWQSATNPTAAIPGSPLETDAVLRQRQTTSTMLPSVSALDGIIGAVAAVTGVIAYACYENDTAETDSNGIPSHSISFVVSGGDAQTIANAIAGKKTPGCGTWGGINGVDPGYTSETVIDPYDIPHQINFFTTVTTPVTIRINITALTGYTSLIGTTIVNTVINYVNALPIGADVYLSKVTAIANLTVPQTNTFNITSILMSANGGALAASDLSIGFNAQANTNTTLITLLVPP